MPRTSPTLSRRRQSILPRRHLQSVVRSVSRSLALCRTSVIRRHPRAVDVRVWPWRSEWLDRVILTPDPVQTAHLYLQCQPSQRCTVEEARRLRRLCPLSRSRGPPYHQRRESLALLHQRSRRMASAPSSASSLDAARRSASRSYQPSALCGVNPSSSPSRSLRWPRHRGSTRFLQR